MALCLESISAQADFFKVQMFDPKKLSGPWRNQSQRYKLLEIDESTLNDLQEMCKNYGGTLMATVNTPNRLDLLQLKNVYNVKIASGQIHPLLIQALCRFHWERVFVSTGMIADPEDLNMITELKDCCDELVVMHCVSLYPTHDSECNLSRISSLREVFPTMSIGYSDHQMDDLSCVASMAMGAAYIEKHVKLEPCFGPTSEIAATMTAFATLCGVRKRIERMWGDGRLSMQEREGESYEHYKGRYMLDG
jgi:sialic acid synthase SpsE